MYHAGINECIYCKLLLCSGNFVIKESFILLLAFGVLFYSVYLHIVRICCCQLAATTTLAVFA
jgi:hypothetical protein